VRFGATARSGGPRWHAGQPVGFSGYLAGQRGLPSWARPLQGSGSIYSLVLACARGRALTAAVRCVALPGKAAERLSVACGRSRGCTDAVHQRTAISPRNCCGFYFHIKKNIKLAVFFVCHRFPDTEYTQHTLRMRLFFRSVAKGPKRLFRQGGDLRLHYRSKRRIYC
jgi:hypothetical protein